MITELPLNPSADELEVSEPMEEAVVANEPEAAADSDVWVEVRIWLLTDGVDSPLASADASVRPLTHPHSLHHRPIPPTLFRSRHSRRRLERQRWSRRRSLLSLRKAALQRLRGEPNPPFNCFAFYVSSQRTAPLTRCRPPPCWPHRTFLLSVADDKHLRTAHLAQCNGGALGGGQQRQHIGRRETNLS
jgi:hypothetical protein